MGNARVDVILPYRNAAATLDAALCGLLARPDDSISVLAVDDGSTDSSAARVRAWAQRDRRVIALRGEGRGLAHTLNLALSRGDGSLVARMDADDLTHPERLARQRAHLLEHPTIGILGTRVEAFVERGSLGEGLTRYVAWQNGLLSPEDHRRERFIESPLCHPSVMMRRSLLARIGGYRSLEGPEDYELFLRAIEHGASLAKLPDVLLAWRHREGRATFADSRYGLAQFRAVKAPYLAREIARTGKPRVVMWGAGPTGRRLARELERQGVRCALFVDIDPHKIGRTARGAPVAAASALDPTSDLVVAAVGARGARDLIRPALTSMGFREGVDAWFAS